MLMVFGSPNGVFVWSVFPHGGRGYLYAVIDRLDGERWESVSSFNPYPGSLPIPLS